jgi:hypothetical protein
MVKTFATIAFVLASLVVADSAMARGHRRGCSSCNSGGCAGGACYAPVAPSKMAATTNVPPGLVSEAPASASAVTAAQPQNTVAYNTGRRGLFGRR